MTLLQYFNTPETVLPSELIDGVRHVADAPFVSHQRVVLRLATALQDHAASAGGEVLVAPVDVILDEHRPVVLQPDLLYLAPDQTLMAIDRIYGAPALVVEVLSPRPRIGDLNARLDPVCPIWRPGDLGVRPEHPRPRRVAMRRRPPTVPGADSGRPDRVRRPAGIHAVDAGDPGSLVKIGAPSISAGIIASCAH